MKSLTSEQQTELRDLLFKVSEMDVFDIETSNQLNYWVIELKPKRVRKKIMQTPETA